MENKKEKEVQEIQEVEELNLDDLEEVSGGKGLRDVVVTKTHYITKSVETRA